MPKASSDKYEKGKQSRWGCVDMFYILPLSSYLFALCGGVLLF